MQLAGGTVNTTAVVAVLPKNSHGLGPAVIRPELSGSETNYALILPTPDSIDLRQISTIVSNEGIWDVLRCWEIKPAATVILYCAAITMRIP